MRVKECVFKEMIEKITRCLREYDPNIVEIIQFGSSVYSPKQARDLDLIVFYEKEKGLHWLC